MNYKIADVVFDIETIYNASEKYMQDYISSEPYIERIRTSEEEIDELINEGYDAPRAYLESLIIFKKISLILLDKYDGIIFHSSAIIVNGGAYLFTAPSGTGKSTHARMWREVYGDKVKMLNDDKPLIRKINGKFIVYGNPWRGKHELGENCSCELKAICKIERSDVDYCEPLGEQEGIETVLNQTLRNKNVKSMSNLLGLIDDMINSVKLYKIGCTPTHNSAKVAYEKIIGEEDEN